MLKARVAQKERTKSYNILYAGVVNTLKLIAKTAGRVINNFL